MSKCQGYGNINMACQDYALISPTSEKKVKLKRIREQFSVPILKSKYFVYFSCIHPLKIFFSVSFGSLKMYTYYISITRNKCTSVEKCCSNALAK